MFFASVNENGFVLCEAVNTQSSHILIQLPLCFSASLARCWGVPPTRLGRKFSICLVPVGVAVASAPSVGYLLLRRYLANKCSIASRIDCFMDGTTSVFGDKLKEQVEERLRFYEEGTAPRKNLTVMQVRRWGVCCHTCA